MRDGASAYRRLFILLRQEAGTSAPNRINELYREEGLTVRNRRATRRTVRARASILVEARANAHWSVHLVHDQFTEGRRFSILNILDDVTRECLAAVSDTSIPGHRIAQELTALSARHARLSAGYRGGSAFQRTRQANAELLLREFKGRMHDELLNETLFLGFSHATTKIVEWIARYNHQRPHSTYGNQTPAVFAANLPAKRDRLPTPEQLRRSHVATQTPHGINLPGLSSPLSEISVVGDPKSHAETQTGFQGDRDV